MKQYLDLFLHHRQELEAHAPAVLNRQRERAARALTELGMPRRHDEDYRYTDVASALAPDYGFQLGGSASTALTPNDERLAADLYAQLARPEDDALAALNTMLAQDVLLVFVPSGTKMKRQVRLFNPPRNAQPLMAHRRILVVAEPDSHLQLVLDDKVPSNEKDVKAETLTTTVTEIYVRRGASVEVYENEHTHTKNHRFSQLYVYQESHSSFTHASLTLQCGLTRNLTRIQLAEPHAEATLLGCTVADGTQHVDANTLIHHIASDCSSHELYKYVLDGKAEGAFTGRILVRPDAQHTLSDETNANLVCTPEAHMWTQPILEIYADDVRCSHGATTGQLSADALFYMQQRGLPPDEARLLLKQAFAADVISRVPDAPIRERFLHLLEQRFSNQLTNCRECHRCL